MDRIEILLRAYPFQDSSRHELEALLPFFRHHAIGAEDFVWRFGDPADRLWFVLRGQARNVITNLEGDEIVTQVVGPGESFGQPALFLTDVPRLGTCVATVASEFLSLGRDPLLRFLETHPAAMRRMLESMSLLILSQSDLYRGVAFHDVRGRVAYQLLKFADEYGEPVSGGIRIPLKLSQSTIAGLTATSRESVNRVLAAFLEAGSIRREDGYIVVAQREALSGALRSELVARAGRGAPR